MSDHPQYTWRHGIAWLVAAAVFFWVGAGHWFGPVTPTKSLICYGLAIAFAIIGIYTIVKDQGPR